MKAYLGVFLGMLTVSSAFSAPLEVFKPWPGISDPLLMSGNFVRTFSHLPLKAAVRDDRKYWTSDWWPLKKGNINYRWNSPRPKGFNLDSPSKIKAQRMSLQELAELAPSEKFDLFMGRYDYPLKKDVEKRVSPERSLWEGICHGWAPAMSNHNEPTPKVVMNPDGIEIPFGSADIKGLLSYYYAYEHYAPNHQMGGRCYSGRTWWRWRVGEECIDDMNAGAFHIVLGNRVGLLGMSFVADIENGSQVWNHVPHSYHSTITHSNLAPASNAAPETRKVIQVRTTVDYVFSGKGNLWEPVLGTSHQVIKQRTYEYTLDLDSAGNIIGGDWVSSARPDFLWLIQRTPGFNEKFGRLHELLDD